MHIQQRTNSPHLSILGGLTPDMIGIKVAESSTQIWGDKKTGMRQMDTQAH